MKLIKISGICALLAASSNFAVASDVNPADVKANSAQQFIIYYIKPSTKIDEVEDFKYSVAIKTSEKVENVYYYQALYFKKSSLYYSGIQPHTDGTVDFRFSTFASGSTTTSKTCHLGADGGSGVTCGINIPYTPGGIYTLETKRVASNSAFRTYVGTVRDETTGVETEIGSWSVPASFGGLKPNATGVVELYKSKRFSFNSCAALPLVNAQYTNVLYNGSVYSAFNSIASFNAGNNHSVVACAGMPRSKNGKYTATLTGFDITNSDDQSPIIPEPLWDTSPTPIKWGW